LSSIRNSNNRIRIMWILTLLIFLNFSFFVLNFNIIGYIIFSLLGLLLNPLYRISEHVFDLRLMDTMNREWWDFFSTMILRDFMLWIWRIIALLLILLSISKWYDNEVILKIGLFTIPIFMILAWSWIFLHLKYESNK